MILMMINLFCLFQAYDGGYSSNIDVLHNSEKKN